MPLDFLIQISDDKIGQNEWDNFVSTLKHDDSISFIQAICDIGKSDYSSTEFTD